MGRAEDSKRDVRNVRRGDGARGGLHDAQLRQDAGATASARAEKAEALRALLKTALELAKAENRIVHLEAQIAGLQATIAHLEGRLELKPEIPAGVTATVFEMAQAAQGLGYLINTKLTPMRRHFEAKEMADRLSVGFERK